MGLQKRLQSAAADIRAELNNDLRQTLDRAFVYLRSTSIASHALRAGEVLPDFELQSATGETVGHNYLLRSGAGILTFYWGGWSPLCMLYLRSLQNSLETIEAAGASVIAVSPERPRELRATARLNELKLALLSDEGGKLARLFGLTFNVPDDLQEVFVRLGIDIATYNATDDLVLPMPATYVIDREGLVAYAFVDPDPMRRPDPVSLLKEVGRLTGLTSPMIE
jgi:peroxiredoxin